MNYPNNIIIIKDLK